MRGRCALAVLSVAFLLKAQSGKGWELRETVDQMTDKKGFEATLRSPVGDSGRSGMVNVTATCASEVVRLNIVYKSETDKNLVFQLMQPNPSVAFGQIDIPKPRVNIRMRIDDAPVKIVSSETDFSNEVNLFFSEISPGQAMADLGGPQGSHDLTPLFRLFATAASAGTIDQLYNARLIRLELPLSNGETPLLRITPHNDPEFQKFAARCATAYPMIKQTFIIGGSPFTTPLPAGIIGVLGDHKLIPAAGARFVPVTEEAAKQIVVKQARRWYNYDPNLPPDPDYAPMFKSAALLPARTEFSNIETSKPRFIVAAPGQDPRARQLVTVSVGRGSVDLVKLADGRFGLIPNDDVFQGYTDYRRKLPDPLQAGPRPSTQASDTPPDDRKFTGTVEQFAAALPNFLKRAAADWQLDPGGFPEESAYILNLARTCSQITPKMLDTVRNPANDDIDIQKLENGRFKQCDSINTYLVHQPRFLVFDISSLSAAMAARRQAPPGAFEARGIELAGPRRPSGWLDGESIMLQVKFTRLPSDTYDQKQPHPPAYWIFQATIIEPRR